MVADVGNGVVDVVVVVVVVVTAKIKTLNFLSVNPPAPVALTVKLYVPGVEIPLNTPFVNVAPGIEPETILYVVASEA